MIQLHTLIGFLRKTGIFLFFLFAAVLTTKAQVKIGNNPTNINRSAILELESTRQGFLLPRLSDTTGINGLTPPDGMMIYLEPGAGNGRGLYIRKSGYWQRITTDSSASRAWTVDGNIIDTAAKFGSLNAQDVRLIANSIDKIRIKATGATTFYDSVHIASRLEVRDSITTQMVKALDSAYLQDARIGDSLYLTTNLLKTAFNDVLVINPTTGAVSRRTLDTAAFKGLTIGNFANTDNAQGLQRKTGAPDAPDTLILHAASFAAPGGVSNTKQGFSGTKVFRDSLLIGDTTTAGGTPNSTVQIRGSVSYNIRTVTGSTTLSITDYTLLVNPTGAGTSTITLPDPAGLSGRVYIIKKVGGSDIDAVVAISGPFEGATASSTYSIYNSGTFVKLQTDGTSWYVIER
ncbi:hypothetical protein HNQ91_005665 [Filimonas zeae]|uniref:hypothetical protein n=1 Tax=Filimonas zeae TaxID=1737353 RepID=UPI00166B607C|nr:hypothetical protein [Filimonas zeae]MDR6342581.1 hypothetical protein [Filimonas zeae]